MARVTLYQDELLSRDLDETDPGDDYFNCGSAKRFGLAGVGVSGPRRAARCKTDAEVAAGAHGQQAFTVYVRQAAMEILANRTLRLAYEGQTAYIYIDPPITVAESPPWSPLGQVMTRTSLLANVTKMKCPSFSLPAGSPTFGGSCPGAKQGMTIESPQALNIDSDGKQLIRELTKPPKTRAAAPKMTAEKWYATAVCQHCYAVAGNYQYFSKQLGQLVIYAWTQQAVKNGTFVPALVEAIERSPFHQSDPRERRHLEAWGYKRVFRLHDSGDFYSPQYVAAWKTIADHFLPGKGSGTPTIFWAPTRLWAAGTARNWLKLIGPAGNLRTNNLVVRPSAFNTNQRCPTPVLGEVAGSTVHVGEAEAERELQAEGIFDYVCPASRKAEKANNCLQVRGPDGEMGCRACWTQPQLTISYHIH